MPDPDLDLNRIPEHEAEAIQSFLLEISRRSCLPNRECELNRLLMNLPAKINLKYMSLDFRPQFSCRVDFISPLDSGDMMLRASKGSQVNSFLNILIACGFSVKKVQIWGQIEQSTSDLLKTLQSSNFKVPSLLDLSLASVRSRLPHPLTDEVLERIELPKTLYEEIKREKLLKFIKNLLQPM